MLELNQITALHARCTELWHREPLDNPYAGVLALVCDQFRFNFSSGTRRTLPAAREPPTRDLAAVKRAIDKLNQQRNDLIEQLDDWLIAELAARQRATGPDARLNTETPGSAIDRLSILALRIYHMESRPSDRTPHRRTANGSELYVSDRSATICRNSLVELLADICSAGRKRHRQVYRQFKMYNDPTMNPYLYGAGPQRAGADSPGSRDCRGCRNRTPPREVVLKGRRSNCTSPPSVSAKIGCS